jgi:hypothetical protein
MTGKVIKIISLPFFIALAGCATEQQGRYSGNG